MDSGRPSDDVCPHDHLVPQDERDIRDKVCLRALFRRDRPGKALRETPPKVLPRRRATFPPTAPDFEFQKDWCGTPDSDFAYRHGFPVERSPKRPNRWRMEIPPYRLRTPGAKGKKGGNPIVTELETRILFWRTFWVDHVVQVTVRGGRIAYVHSFLDRVGQRMILRALQPRADARMSPHSHAYRPGRSRFTALQEARSLVRSGYYYAAHVDIVKFYESVNPDYLIHALSWECRWTSEPLKEVMLGYCVPEVVRQGDHPMAPVPGSPRLKTMLLTGSVLAPFLANLFATHFIDRPLEHALDPDTRFLRYSDNIVILGTSPSAVERGLNKLNNLIGEAGLALHGPVADPVDVRVTPLRWLGKLVHGRSVVTPDAKLRKYLDRLEADPVEWEDFRSAAVGVWKELWLDPRPERRVQQIARQLGYERGKRQVLMRFERCLRGERGPSDPEPDDRVHDAARGAE